MTKMSLTQRSGSTTMKYILDNWGISVQTKDSNEQLSILIYIASLTHDSLESLEVETASKICSTIYTTLYESDFTMLQQFLTQCEVIVKSFKINIRNQPLWQAIWINAIKYFPLLPSKYCSEPVRDAAEILLWCIEYILQHIDILDRNSWYLLRSLQLILHRSDVLVPSVCVDILNCMGRAAISPHIGFRQIAQDISDQAMVYVDFFRDNKIYCNDLLPIKGINTADIVRTYSVDFIQENVVIIVNKVLVMFSNNVESKDGGFLYETLLVSTFEEWVDNVYPHFFPKLQKIEHEGEFFQSLLKYWVPLTVVAYKTDFYKFMKEEPIDLKLKVHIILQSRKKGFQDELDTDVVNTIETTNLALAIVSIYRKKCLCPETEDIDFLMYFLRSNLKTSLEDEELDSIKRFFSQMFFFAHIDLRISEDNFNFFKDFIDKIYVYCYSSFRTEFFQVGAQVLRIFLSTLKGSHKDLNLSYKIEKRFFYENGENRLFIKVKEIGLWKFDHAMFRQISSCFLRTKFNSLILTDLLSIHYPQYCAMDAETIKKVLKETEDTPNIQNTEKIINCSNLLFGQEDSLDRLKFLEEISDLLLEKLTTKSVNEKDFFKQILYLEILTCAKRHNFEVEAMNNIVTRSLELIDFVLRNTFMKTVSYRWMKVLETFITRVMYFISANMKDIWKSTDKKFAVQILINIIQKSNMKKAISVGTDILRQFGFKMEEHEHDKIFKIHLVNETLQTINELPTTNYLKIRRNPETRLVIHAMCISQRDRTKPFIHWAMDHLLNVISYPKATDSAISSSLHTIELLVCDNRLHSQTLRYIKDIIIQCVGLFKRADWMVRNADLQLAKSLVERLYGVSMTNSYRPKSILDLFVFYPELASHFFKILSADNLDERSVIILQFFSESQVKEYVFKDDISEILEYFQILFVHIIKNYENHYGKLAVKSYVALCSPKDIPDSFVHLESYLITNLNNLPKNILANVFLLMQELYEKYRNSYENIVKPEGLMKIHCIWSNILQYLKRFDPKLLDLLLIKIKSVDNILVEKHFQNNLWVHNNLSFLFLNANSNHICVILNDEKFHEAPEFFQVKMLSILLQRFEQDEFSKQDLSKITNSVFYRSLLATENNNLLNCYFKYLLVFQQHIAIQFFYDVSFSKNSYKNMLNLLYLANSYTDPPESFFDLVIADFKSKISLNEEVDNDILSTLTISYSRFPQKCRLDICKIVFYLSLLKSTHLEAYNFISMIMNKTYSSILECINDFISGGNLVEILGDENAKIFLNDVTKYLDINENDTGYEDEFYIVESEVLVPKDFIRKMLRCKTCFNKRFIDRNK